MCSAAGRMVLLQKKGECLGIKAEVLVCEAAKQLLHATLADQHGPLIIQVRCVVHKLTQEWSHDTAQRPARWFSMGPCPKSNLCGNRRAQ